VRVRNTYPRKTRTEARVRCEALWSGGERERERERENEKRQIFRESE
jgi:hypothetical protein